MFLVLLFSNFWIKLQLVVHGLQLFEWLLDDEGNRRSQHILVNWTHKLGLKRSSGERGGQALSWGQLKAITDALLPPCGTSYNINGGNLDDKTRCSCTFIVSSVFVPLVSVCLLLKMAKCKKMATTASSDSSICQVLFSSGIKVDGKLQHLFLQTSTGFCSFIHFLKCTKSCEDDLLCNVWKTAIE